MKKHYLILLAFICISFNLSSQCTPIDCSGSLPPFGGICGTEYEDANVNEPYSDFESFVLTAECFDAGEIDPGNAGTIIYIDEVSNFTFSGLPQGITLATDQSSYMSMPGGPTLGCIAVDGTPTEAGVFETTSDFDATVQAFILGGCPTGFAVETAATSSYSISLTVIPDASFTGLNGPYCEGDDDVTLMPTGTMGGEFSGPGVSGNTFSPTDAGPGVHAIEYEVSAQEGNAVAPATASSTMTVVVDQADEYFADADGDGFGDADDVALSCTGAPNGYISDDTDCDDSDGAVYPGAMEVCNGIDDNCDGTVDEGFDNDGDGVSSCDGDCDDNDGDVFPGSTEICNGVDDNCDGDIDEGFDFDGDGVTTCGGDCDDEDGDVFPGSTEICNGVDDNCDGVIDEGFDADGDGFKTCEGDCDDNNPEINPNAVDLCDGVDLNCDGIVQVDTMVSLDISICIGDIYVVDGNEFTEPGNYLITFAGVNGCDSIVDLALTQIGELPNFIPLASDTLCLASPAIDLANNVMPTGGAFSGNGITGTSFDPALAGAGTHVITYETMDSSCVYATTYEITTMVCTDVAEAEIDLDQIKIYPNPVVDILNIEFEINFDASVNVKLLNSQLETVKVKRLSKAEKNKLQFDSSDLSAGVYFVQVQSGTGHFIKKIQITH